jgi:hypothetical protein
MVKKPQINTFKKEYKNRYNYGYFSYNFGLKNCQNFFHINYKMSNYRYHQYSKKKITKHYIPQWGGRRYKKHSNTLIYNALKYILSSQFEYEYTLGDLQFILNRFNINYGKTSIYNYLKKFNYSYKKGNNVYLNKVNYFII